MTHTPLQTPLYTLHVEQGAKMVDFAGYHMPVFYPKGIIEEHHHTRNHAGIFDVSHMGSVFISGTSQQDVMTTLQKVIAADLTTLKPGYQKYSQLLNDKAGIIDDLIIGRPLDEHDQRLCLVINAACKHKDLAYLRAQCPSLTFEEVEHHALIAIQGPEAKDVLFSVLQDERLHTQPFMTQWRYDYQGHSLLVARAGYTGEDGFEVLIPADMSVSFTKLLLKDNRAAMIGLGARDTLRLEAGLCLYGHDLDENTTPVEAGLTWSIGKNQRTNPSLLGGNVIQQQIQEGVSKKRVGFKINGKRPAREGCQIVTHDGTVVGHITSGGFSPTLQEPIAMGYIEKDASDKELFVMIRNDKSPITFTAMPFVEQRYYRAPKS